MAISRRQFTLSLCSLPFAARAGELAPGPWNEPGNVSRVYLATDAPHWPKTNLDIPREVAEIEARLAEVGRAHAHNIRFSGGEVIRKAEEVKPWLAKAGDIDGVPLCR